MKWLFWSKIDLENGLGGVETHARSVARELRKNGVRVTFSQHPGAPMDDAWDVVSTHGNQFHYSYGFAKWLKHQKKTYWFHTLHGWSFERMKACKEFFWLGGYKASVEEGIGAVHSHQCFAIHGNLSLTGFINNPILCHNGWDTWDEDVIEGDQKTEGKFIFIGRGQDPVKGASRIKPLAEKFKFIAIPGEGFEKNKNVTKTGRYTPTEIQKALLKCRGLVVPSLYEGLPIVVLEALALGVPVIATPVGGLTTLSKEIQGLYFTSKNAENLEEKLESMANQETEDLRLKRRKINRQFLKTWKDVADIYYHKAIRLLGYD